MKNTVYEEDIIALNRDLEPAVIQGSYGRSMYFEDPYKPLQFVHFSDIHAILDLWNRMVEYINHYSDYISFALHTGDYCGGHQEVYTDFYRDGTPCVRPVLNCVGNHDTVTPDGKQNTKESTHRLLFNHTEGWDVQFMDISHSMTYYKDFPESNIRLIVLDLYYNVEEQTKWLREVLNDARETGIHVITAMHEPTDAITNRLDTPFCSIVDYQAVGAIRASMPYEDVIVAFIQDGGQFVCNLAGHWHHDKIGYTSAGVLNIAVECATKWYHWCDGIRIPGTRTYDCFNVMSVDTNQKLIRLIRIGDNTDNTLRIKRTLCYDYGKRKLIWT